MTSIVHKPGWQQAYALAWERILRRFESLRGSLSKGEAMSAVIREFDGALIDAGKGVKPLRISPGTVYRKWKEWTEAGRSLAALASDYKPGQQKTPQELINEFQRRLTLEGVTTATVAMKWIEQDWTEGKAVPGLGTWQQWWVRNCPGRPLPEAAPQFPVHRRSLYRNSPTKSLRALGNRGLAAFKCEAAFVSRDYAQLRPGELYVLDDKRVDLLVIDDLTGEVVDCTAYVMMEGCSRRIVGFVLKAARAMSARDVIALIARVLESEGYSEQYITHILLERGTVALPQLVVAKVEQLAEGHVKIHRTTMIGGEKAAGAVADKGSGNWMGKAIIESFMRKIDLLTMHLPGQRGNKHEAMPANLAWSMQRKSKPTADGDVMVREVKGGVAAEAEMLARCEIMLGRKIGLQAPLLYLTEFNTIFRELMQAHNASRAHEYQDFGTVPQFWDPTAGNWRDLVQQP